MVITFSKRLLFSIPLLAGFSFVQENAYAMNNTLQMMVPRSMLSESQKGDIALAEKIVVAPKNEKTNPALSKETRITSKEDLKLLKELKQLNANLNRWCETNDQSDREVAEKNAITLVNLYDSRDWRDGVLFVAFEKDMIKTICSLVLERVAFELAHQMAFDLSRSFEERHHKYCWEILRALVGYPLTYYGEHQGPSGPEACLKIAENILEMAKKLPRQFSDENKSKEADEIVAELQKFLRVLKKTFPRLNNKIK